MMIKLPYIRTFGCVRCVLLWIQIKALSSYHHTFAYTNCSECSPKLYSLRDGWRHQNGWIFGKFPKKFAIWFSENEGGRSPVPDCEHPSMINLADLFKGSIAYCNIIQSEIVFQIWWSVFKKWTIRMLPGDLIAYVKKVSGEGHLTENLKETRSSWLNCALRGYEAVYWVSVGQ